MILRLLLAAALLLLCDLSALAANRFAVCTVTCTWDNSSTAMWATSTGGAPGASAPGSADAVILDAATCVGGVTCTITVNADLTVQTITMGACTASTAGCILDFSANNNNVTLSGGSAFSGTGTGTRTLNMGNGTWTFTEAIASSTPWTMATTTNLTFSANNSTMVFTATAAGTRTFAGGGLSYHAIAISANSGMGPFNIQSANTFSSFAITAPNAMTFPNAVNTTITAAFTWTGTSSLLLSLQSASQSSVAGIVTASGAPAITWAGIRGITFSGGATFAATNSLDLGLNTGATITAPSGSGGGGGGIIGG